MPYLRITTATNLLKALLCITIALKTASPLHYMYYRFIRCNFSASRSLICLHLKCLHRLHYRCTVCITLHFCITAHTFFLETYTSILKRSLRKHIPRFWACIPWIPGIYSHKFLGNIPLNFSGLQLYKP